MVVNFYFLPSRTAIIIINNDSLLTGEEEEEEDHHREQKRGDGIFILRAQIPGWGSISFILLGGLKTSQR